MLREGDKVKVLADTAYPHHVGRVGRVKKVWRTGHYPIAITFNGLPLPYYYKEKELEVVRNNQPLLWESGEGKKPASPASERSELTQPEDQKPQV